MVQSREEGGGGWSTWKKGWSTWEEGIGVPGRRGLEYLEEGFKYLGEGGRSAWERRGRLEYLREGGWSTWERGVGLLGREFVEVHENEVGQPP